MSPQEKEELIAVVNGTIDPAEEVDDFVEINPEEIPKSLGNYTSNTSKVLKIWTFRSKKLPHGSIRRVHHHFLPFKIFEAQH